MNVIISKINKVIQSQEVADNLDIGVCFETIQSAFLHRVQSLEILDIIEAFEAFFKFLKRFEGNEDAESRCLFTIKAIMEGNVNNKIIKTALKSVNIFEEVITLIIGYHNKNKFNLVVVTTECLEYIFRLMDTKGSNLNQIQFIDMIVLLMEAYDGNLIFMSALWLVVCQNKSLLKYLYNNGYVIQKIEFSSPLMNVKWMILIDETLISKSYKKILNFLIRIMSSAFDNWDFIILKDCCDALTWINRDVSEKNFDESTWEPFKSIEQKLFEISTKKVNLQDRRKFLRWFGCCIEELLKMTKNTEKLAKIVDSICRISFNFRMLKSYLMLKGAVDENLIEQIIQENKKGETGFEQQIDFWNFITVIDGDLAEKLEKSMVEYFTFKLNFYQRFNSHQPIHDGFCIIFLTIVSSIQKWAIQFQSIKDIHNKFQELEVFGSIIEKGFYFNDESIIEMCLKFSSENETIKKRTIKLLSNRRTAKESSLEIVYTKVSAFKCINGLEETIERVKNMDSFQTSNAFEVFKLCEYKNMIQDEEVNDLQNFINSLYQAVNKQKQISCQNKVVIQKQSTKILEQMDNIENLKNVVEKSKQFEETLAKQIIENVELQREKELLEQENAIANAQQKNMSKTKEEEIAKLKQELSNKHKQLEAEDKEKKRLEVILSVQKREIEKLKAEVKDWKKMAEDFTVKIQKKNQHQ